MALYNKYDKSAQKFTMQHEITEAITSTPSGATYLLDRLRGRVGNTRQPVIGPVHEDTRVLIENSVEGPEKAVASDNIRFLEGFQYDSSAYKKAVDTYYETLDRLMNGCSESDKLGFEYEANGDLYQEGGIAFNPRLSNPRPFLAADKAQYITDRTRRIALWMGQYMRTFQPKAGNPRVNNISADKEGSFSTSVAYKLFNFEAIAHTPMMVQSFLDEAKRALDTGAYQYRTFLEFGTFPTCYEGGRLQSDSITRSGISVTDFKKRVGTDWFGNEVEAVRTLDNGLYAVRYRKFVPYGVRMNGLLQVWSADMYKWLHTAFHGVMDTDPKAMKEYCETCDEFTVADISKCDVNTSFELHSLLADVLMPPDEVNPGLKEYFLFLLQLPQYERPDYVGMRGLRFSHEPGVFQKSPNGTTSGISTVAVITKFIGILGLTEISVEAGRVPDSYDDCVRFWNNLIPGFRGKTVGDNISMGSESGRDLVANFTKSAEVVRWHDFRVDPRGALAGFHVDKDVYRVNLLNYSRKILLPEFSFGGKHSPFKLFGLLVREDVYSTHPAFPAAKEALDAFFDTLTASGEHTFAEYINQGRTLTQLTAGQRQALDKEFGVLSWDEQRFIMEPTSIHYIDGMLESIPEHLLRRMFGSIPSETLLALRKLIYTQRFLNSQEPFNDKVGG